MIGSNWPLAPGRHGQLITEASTGALAVSGVLAARRRRGLAGAGGPAHHGVHVRTAEARAGLAGRWRRIRGDDGGPRLARLPEGELAGLERGVSCPLKSSCEGFVSAQG